LHHEGKHWRIDPVESKAANFNPARLIPCGNADIIELNITKPRIQLQRERLMRRKIAVHVRCKSCHILQPPSAKHLPPPLRLELNADSIFFSFLTYSSKSQRNIFVVV